MASKYQIKMIFKEWYTVLYVINKSNEMIKKQPLDLAMWKSLVTRKKAILLEWWGLRPDLIGFKKMEKRGIGDKSIMQFLQ